MTACNSIRTVVTLAMLATSVIAAQDDRPHNEAERDTCNASLGYTEAFIDSLNEKLGADQKSLFLKHAAIFSPCSQTVCEEPSYSEPMKVSEEDRKTLESDLSALLDVVWTIEMRIVRKAYPAKGHSVPFSHLRAMLDDDTSEFGAWACVSVPPRVQANAIRISPALVRSIWKNALDEQFAEPDYEIWAPDELKTPNAFLKIIENMHPVSFQEEIEIAKSGAENRTPALRNEVLHMLEAAHREYVKALLFVLAHEAAHIWLDRCPDMFSASLETRADAYGLLVSTAWLNEGFQPLALALDLENTRRKALQDWRRRRREARERLRRGKYKSLDEQLSEGESALEVSLEPDKDEDEKTAKMTDADIRAAVDRDFPKDGESDIKPLGRLGFETFNDVYTKIGLREYIEGNTTHPALELRYSRLKKAYAAESSMAPLVLRRLGKNTAQFRKALASGNDQFLERALTPVLMNLPKSYPECEIGK